MGERFVSNTGWIRGWVIGLVLVGLVGPGRFTGAMAQGKPERVIIQYPTVAEVYLPVTVALRKGFFRDEGLEVKYVRMGSSLALKALVAGDLDYVLSFSTAVRAAVGGMKVKAILGMAVKPNHFLITKPTIQSVGELKGKVVGVAGIGDATDYVFREVARQSGLNPERDLTVVTLGPNPVRLAALQAGSIDATPLNFAYAAKAAALGLRVLVDISQRVNLAMSGLATTDRRIQERPQEVRRVVRALLRGLAFSKSHREEAREILMDDLKLDRQSATWVYDKLLTILSQDGTIPPEQIRTDIEMSKKALQIQKEIPLSAVIDWSFITPVKE